MRIAAIYDIHGNLPTLEAVVSEILADEILVGGDVLPGLLPRETLEYLLQLDIPKHFLHGNGDRRSAGTNVGPRKRVVSRCTRSMARARAVDRPTA